MTIQRAEQIAHDAGLTPAQTQFCTADASTWQSPTPYHLVIATFLHWQGDFDRAGALRRAKEIVAPGGHLLVISHAEFPPWATAHDQLAGGHDHKHEATSPDSELEILQLNPHHRNIELAQLRTRDAPGPQGEQATLHDTVILAQRS